jgi:NADH:ubiquinone oxidoreductase subunit 6 (subunit J)
MPLSVLSPIALFRLNEVWPLWVVVPCVLGGAGVFLMLPRPQGNRTALLGALLAGTALLAGAFLLVRTRVFSAETVLFYVFAALALGGGVLLVTQRNPARAALSFALVVLSTSGLFLLLAAPFLMAATIIIYAGAIIVTFLFVLMLASQLGLTDADARTREPLLATALGFLLLGCLVYVLQISYEKNDTVKFVEDQLAKTRHAKARLAENRFPPPDYLDQLKKEIDDATESAAKQGRPGGDLGELSFLRQQIDTTLYSEWPPPATANAENMGVALTKLEALLERSLQQRGWLRPVDHLDARSLSDLSGPPAVAHQPVPGAQRYDNLQRPPMPADNATYLGRSLFTDFLLPVELGGVLLLVATIGAIAIAHRRAANARAS